MPLSSSLKMSIPAQSWSPGYCWKQCNIPEWPMAKHPHRTLQADGEGLPRQASGRDKSESCGRRARLIKRTILGPSAYQVCRSGRTDLENCRRNSINAHRVGGSGLSLRGTWDVPFLRQQLLAKTPTNRRPVECGLGWWTRWRLIFLVWRRQAKGC